MSSRIRVQISVEQGCALPEYATADAAGMDLRANEDVVIAPGQRHAVATGIRIAVPPGYEAQIRPRSGLALNKGISIPNAPGTIDADYRGEVKAILINLGSEPFEIKKGDRIAQMVIAPVSKAEWEIVDELVTTTRGSGGFGSTGSA